MHERDRGPTMTQQLSALITGASTGIGHATALALHKAGMKVWATARQPQSLATLDAAGLRTLRLDVTDEESMRDAVATVLAEDGGVDVLVNNAGYALQLPVEQADMDQVRQQFETNVFGAVRLVQLVLPRMRERGSGRIIMVGSMGGRFTLPGGGFYHASKHALEALSDALRLEVAGFGVGVCLIQPGPVRTSFAGTAVSSSQPVAHGVADPKSVDQVYATFNRKLGSALANAYRGNGAWYDPSAEDVAEVVVRAVTTGHPRPRYAVGLTARVMMNSRRLLPDQLFDILITRLWPTPDSAQPS